jgi:hypothetical protein
VDHARLDGATEVGAAASRILQHQEYLTLRHVGYVVALGVGLWACLVLLMARLVECGPLHLCVCVPVLLLPHQSWHLLFGGTGDRLVGVLLFVLCLRA